MDAGDTSGQPDTMPVRARRRRRGPSKGDLKEAAILDTAWQLLAERPMSSITIDDLAGGAGISRSSFYFYFTSRDAVIRALAERTTRELSMAVLEPMRSGGPARDVIASVVANLLARWRTHGPVLRAMDSLSERDPELLAFWDSISHEVVAELAAAIERERALGRAPQGPPSALDLAWSLTHLYWRSAHQLSLRTEPLDDSAVAETLTVMTIRSIYCEMH